MSASDDIRGLAELANNIGDDRIIPIEEGQFAYIATESCAVYLITIQRATFIPAASVAAGSGEERTE